MKELEKVGPKMKGVISQSVQEVVKGLCDDNIVCNDKVGTGMYYWCFPSAEVARRATQEKNLTNEIAALEQRLAAADQALAEAQQARSAEDRDEVLSQLAELQVAEAELQSELSSMAANDPALFEAYEEDAREALDAANRWTDNITTLRSYCLKITSGYTEKSLNEHWEM
jgi:Mnd1 HTH domain/Leucine zipper with capping helix domain